MHRDTSAPSVAPWQWPWHRGTVDASASSVQQLQPTDAYIFLYGFNYSSSILTQIKHPSLS